MPAAALELRAAPGAVVVAPDEVIADDLYVSGETVTIEGRVEGDVIATAREVRIAGEVTGDLIAAGQAVIVDGRVGDDVRMAGMALQLGPGAVIGDDLVAAGFSLETSPRSLTGGSLMFAGAQALLAGDIEESLTGSMNALEIRGAIGADSEVEVGDEGAPSFAQYLPSPVTLPSVAGGLTVADGARIDGELVYVSASEARGGGAGATSLTRREPETTDAELTRKPRWPGRLFHWLGLLLLGLLLAWWVPGWLDRRSRDIRERPLPLAGIGLIGVAALPVVLVLALAVAVAVTVLFGLLRLGGLGALAMVLALAGMALLVLLFWLTSAYLAPLAVGLCTGRWLVSRFAADKAAGIVLPLATGLVLLALLRFVPVLGFLVALVILLLGWGAILWWLWKRLSAAPPVTA